MCVLMKRILLSTIQNFIYCYWLAPNGRVAHDFEKAANHFGKNPQDYAGLICPYAWVNYPPRRTNALREPTKTDSINIRQVYGGGTYGVPAAWQYGKFLGYTGIPFQDRFSRQVKESDGDGIIDYIDPESLYAINPMRKKSKKEIEVPSQFFGTMHTDSLETQIYFDWF